MPHATLNHIDLPRLQQLGHCLAEYFPSELVIGLVGTLGAGKTTFTQALAAAMGIDAEDVTSPTFTLLCSYDAQLAAGPIRLHHLDAYRVSDEDEFLELGVEELFEAKNTWVLIEWADRMRSVLPDETLWMTIDVEESETDDVVPHRRLTLQTNNPDLQRPLNQLVTAMASSSR
ncbi:tRNA (adenosine(37)-N6)-threonylcarbamoyltransferase complex ATPase subunit type 1 TsaE [Stieleria sp. TO1_6]|uniref:tRNA (adenosine(37)-N6)-threonylcarbamoyltransferase complex ATPase subunit type 1 TsaE n=1 Tax=Stieleria tagensis TaxID=2956795 RepID=UPI00209B0F0F|nr:tRNA (adenosine(37)-N6)-threonylcarbamoyltransferase complex ATPase subunit type 1 TsaE [Stieleria tagensis]MCO8121879.1 tRNA (adenosine(37)-N6)-threonylcarbamoyltransferase complex ATPase subunit type 1 TsaE [Stieleria tagensis]